MKDVEVLIVGAGPTGLTLGLLLQRLGVQCAIIDKSEGPSTTSKAFGMQPRISELFSWLNLADTFAARSSDQTRMNLYAQGRRIGEVILGFPPEVGGAIFSPRLLFLPQSETESILGTALHDRGGAVMWRSELVDLEQNNTCVFAKLRDGRAIKAQYLVSCEGAHSVARHACNIPFVGKTYPQTFVMADVLLDNDWDPQNGQAWLCREGMVSAFSLPGLGHWRLIIEAGTFTKETVTLADVEQLYVSRTGDTQTRIRDALWLTRFKVHARIVERFRAGRVFMAGDAAHLLSPLGGQSITTGLQDAYNLGWKLCHVLQHGAPDALLDSYHDERVAMARAAMEYADNSTRVLFAETAWSRWLRDQVIMPILSLRPLQERMARKMSQLDLYYQGGRRTWRLFGKKVGDRAPDITLRGVGDDAVPVTLFELLRQARPIALLTRTSDLANALERLGLTLCITPAHGDWRRVYGAQSGDMWVIRPDGYVGLRCADTNIDEIADYLSQFYDAERVRDVLPATSRSASRRRSAWRAVRLGSR